MLLGVLRMPMPENPDSMTLRQFVNRARQAACRIEADADELAELRSTAEAWRSSRSMFVTQLGDMQQYGKTCLTVQEVLGPVDNRRCWKPDQSRGPQPADDSRSVPSGPWFTASDR